MPIRLAILDFDGTLCSTRDAIATCMGLTFDAFGWSRPHPAEIAAAIASGAIIADALGMLSQGRLSADERSAWALRYRAIYDAGEGLRRTVMFDGVTEGLAALHDAGCRVVILSNKGQTAIEQAVNHFGLSRFIDQSIGNRPDVPHKPDPASWHRIVAPLYPGLPSQDVAMVGDSVADLGYARAIGAVACWARYGFGDPAACLALDPEIILDRFDQLPAALAQRR